MKIGNFEIKNNVFLAPMAGITDLPFRKICKKFGCGMTYTEMVSTKGLYYKDQKTEKLMNAQDEDNYRAIQIFGSDPHIMAKTVYELNQTNFDVIDINMGCPTPKIIKNGDGAALSLDLKLVSNILSEVVKNSIKPVTIKIRAGWDENNINAVEMAKIAEFNGVAAVTVHGRTREQFYRGVAEWGIIKKVKESISIPVIGNGDIFDEKSAQKMFLETNCDAIMVARGAQGNPWIFKHIRHYLDTGIEARKVSIFERINVIKEHLDTAVALKGESTAVKQMRKHISWYVKGLRHASIIKDRVFKLNSCSEVLEVLEQYLAEY